MFNLNGLLSDTFKLKMKVSVIIVTQTSILIKIHYEIDILRRKCIEQ